MKKLLREIFDVNVHVKDYECSVRMMMPKIMRLLMILMVMIMIMMMMAVMSIENNIIKFVYSKSLIPKSDNNFTVKEPHCKIFVKQVHCC